MKQFTTELKRTYYKYDKYAPLLFFVLGFSWDWFTLGRIDSNIELFFLTLYFILLSVCVYISHTYFSYDLKIRYQVYLRKYLPLASQFFIGGLSSAMVVLFSRSASLSKTAIFLFLLAILMIVNEFYRKKLSEYIHFTFYAFISFVYFACIIPVLILKINDFTFIISGIVSFGFTSLLILLIKLKQKSKTILALHKLKYYLLSLYTLILVLYFFRLIPPVPLALTQGIVAQNIYENQKGYVVEYEPESWYKFWKSYNDKVEIIANQPIFVFTSIFAPEKLNKKIYHRWSYYDEMINEWVVTDRISFTIVGGRDNGYRGYSFKKNIKEGLWMVEVITEEDLIISVLEFELLIRNQIDKKQLKTKIL